MWKEIIWRFFTRELRIRYTGSAIGPVWIVLYPLLLTLVSSMVFSLVFKNSMGSAPYYIFVMVGTLVWIYFSQGWTYATRSLISNREIVSNVNFDWSTIVISSVFVKLFDFLVNFVVFIIIYFFAGSHGNIIWIILPLIIGLQTIMIVGLSLMTAALNVYFRDVQNSIDVFLQILYFSTPVVYPLTVVPEKFRWLLHLNPMFYLVNLYRGILFDGRLDTAVLGIVSACALSSLIIGYKCYYHFQYKFPEML